MNRIFLKLTLTLSALCALVLAGGAPSIASQDDSKAKIDRGLIERADASQAELPEITIDPTSVDALIDGFTRGRTKIVTTRAFSNGEKVEIDESWLNSIERLTSVFSPSSRTVTSKGRWAGRSIVEELRLLTAPQAMYVIRDVYLDENDATEFVGHSIPAPLPEPTDEAAPVSKLLTEEIVANAKAERAAAQLAAPYISRINGDTYSDSKGIPWVNNGLVSMSCGTNYNGSRAVNDTTDTYRWSIVGGNFGSTGSVTLAGRPARISTWSPTNVVAYPSVPYDWGAMSTILTITTPNGTINYGVSIAPAIKSRVFGQCTHHVAYKRKQMGRDPSPTAYDGYTTINTTYEPRVGDQFQWNRAHTAIIVAVSPYYSGGWRRYNVQISEQNYDCRNSIRTYWDYFEVGVVNGQQQITHYIQHPSYGRTTLYYR